MDDEEMPESKKELASKHAPRSKKACILDEVVVELFLLVVVAVELFLLVVVAVELFLLVVVAVVSAAQQKKTE